MCIRDSTHPVAHFRETICQSPDPWDLTGLDAGMKQGLNTGFTPAIGHHFKIVIELPKDDVAVAVDKRQNSAAHDLNG